MTTFTSQVTPVSCEYSSTRGLTVSYQKALRIAREADAEIARLNQNWTAAADMCSALHKRISMLESEAVRRNSLLELATNTLNAQTKKVIQLSQRNSWLASKVHDLEGQYLGTY